VLYIFNNIFYFGFLSVVYMFCHSFSVLYVLSLFECFKCFVILWVFYMFVILGVLYMFLSLFEYGLDVIT